MTNSKTLPDEFWLVFDRTGHEAVVDVVEGLGVRPFFFYVVDFENDVCWVTGVCYFTSFIGDVR